MATKAQLEKELKKTQTMLNAALDKLKDVNAPKDNINYYHTDSVVTKIDESKTNFESLVNRLTEELKLTQDYLFSTVDKLRTIDGDDSKPLEKMSSESKVYRMGVVGVYDQLNDMAMDNKTISLHVLNRLKNLVG